AHKAMDIVVDVLVITRDVACAVEASGNCANRSGHIECGERPVYAPEESVVRARAVGIVANDLAADDAVREGARRAWRIECRDCTVAGAQKTVLRIVAVVVRPGDGALVDASGSGADRPLRIKRRDFR